MYASVRKFFVSSFPVPRCCCCCCCLSEWKYNDAFEENTRKITVNTEKNTLLWLLLLLCMGISLPIDYDGAFMLIHEQHISYKDKVRFSRLNNPPIKSDVIAKSIIIKKKNKCASSWSSILIVYMLE